ncbi:MAG: proton-conducting membrane transporter [Aestuariivirgaceae bacterium]
MTNPTLELILWILLAFFIGCILGYLFHKWFAPQQAPLASATFQSGASAPSAGVQSTEPAAEGRPVPVAQPVSGAKPAKEPVPARAKKPAPPAKEAATAKPAASKRATAKITPGKKSAAAKKPAAAAKPSRPQGLAAARDGKADNLQQISGVGPKLEKTLHGLGFFHFDQIAGWSRQEIEWVDEHLRFKGRIDRDEWIKQAQLLAAGNLDEFARQYGSGAAKGKPAKPHSRARKS